MDIVLILIPGLTQKEKPTMWNITSRLIKVLKILQQRKLLNFLVPIRITLPKTCLKILLKEIILHGHLRSSLCQLKMLIIINLMYLMLLKYGPKPIILCKQSESWHWTKILTTILLKQSKVPLHLQTWFQELNPQWIRCYKEDYSHILILTDID